jgi:hypothetical protein
MTFETAAASAFAGVASSVGEAVTWLPASGGSVDLSAIPDTELLEETAHGRTADLVIVLDVLATDVAGPPAIARGDSIVYRGDTWSVTEVLPLDPLVWRVRLGGPS